MRLTTEDKEEEDDEKEDEKEDEKDDEKEEEDHLGMSSASTNKLRNLWYYFIQPDSKRLKVLDPWDSRIILSR